MSSVTSNLYRFGEYTIDAQKRVLKRGSDLVPLTRKGFDVLLLLVQNAGNIVSKQELMNTVWGDRFVEEANLTQTIFMIRKALNETAEERYILTLQGQGYQFLYPVNDAPGTDKPSPLSSPLEVSEIHTPPQPQSWQAWKLPLVGSAALVLILIAAFILWQGHARRPIAEPQGRIMLAVLPFDNFTGDERQEYFSDGLTEEMISQIENLDPAHLGVIARTSIMHYKRSPASIPQIGKELNVQYVIEGSVRRDSERVRISAQLIQVKDQTHLWAREYDRDLGHLLELQDEIAREVANEIEFSLSGRRPINAVRPEAAPPSGTQSYEAYDLYLKGRYFWNKRTGDGFSQAAEYFQKAIDKDPKYGRAYAGLADTFSLMSTWFVGDQNELMPKARTAALRALQLDESLPEAHASLALIKESYEFDWAESEKEFRRAIQLDPQYATAHQWYAEFLSWQGRFPEAFAESEEARRLDPLSPIMATDHAETLYYSRRYEDAVKQCQSVLDFDPNFNHARVLMIRFYLQLGNYDKVLDLVRYEEAHDGSPWEWAWKAAIYGRSGQLEDARRALAKLDEAPTSRLDRNEMFLLAYSATGEKEKVISLLQKAYAERSNIVTQIKVEPMYDLVRDDPRFQTLLTQVGFHP
jgi:TolB-like protein/DNA-binding winged helix-turn-helix (wHTH) protein/Tfp pilus assembly protein PilF